MPELPEVETTKTSLQNLINHTVTNVEVYQPKLRWSVPADLKNLTGYTLTAIKRRAKYLILTFQKAKNDLLADAASQKKVIIHLGMSGSLQQHPANTDKRKHDHIIMTFANADNPLATPYQLHYHDPRRFGAVLWYADYADKLLPHLGVEPLEQSFNADYLYDRIWRKVDNQGNANTPKTVAGKSTVKQPIKRPIKAVIMDQAFVVGVGNIYATESLFLSAIHPLTPANELDKEALTLLVKHIKAVLNKSIQKGGSTLKDFTVADGQTGYFQQTLNVYGKHKQPCPICSAPIDKVTITGRASTFCPRCQPLS